ncbi:MAG: hypothetical protein EOL97_08540 [Spirochaetia bacterium]|nr:hypothetical protein [Spirochaetia bacterium]
MKTINNNISEDILSFENSKEIVRLGFNIKSFPYSYYNHKGEYEGDMTDYIKATVARKDLSELKSIPAPTIALAIKWILENYQIWIFPEWQFGRGKWLFTIYKLDSYDETIKIQENHYKKLGEEEYDTLQEAYQAAINYTLLNLIK